MASTPSARLDFLEVLRLLRDVISADSDPIEIDADAAKFVRAARAAAPWQGLRKVFFHLPTHRILTGYRSVK